MNFDEMVTGCCKETDASHHSKTCYKIVKSCGKETEASHHCKFLQQDLQVL